VVEGSEDLRLPCEANDIVRGVGPEKLEDDIVRANTTSSAPSRLTCSICAVSASGGEGLRCYGSVYLRDLVPDSSRGLEYPEVLGRVQGSLLRSRPAAALDTSCALRPVASYRSNPHNRSQAPN